MNNPIVFNSEIEFLRLKRQQIYNHELYCRNLINQLNSTDNFYEKQALNRGILYHSKQIKKLQREMSCPAAYNIIFKN